MTKTAYDLHKDAAYPTRHGYLDITEMKAYEKLLGLTQFSNWNDDHFDLPGTIKGLEEAEIWGEFIKLVREYPEQDPVAVLVYQKMAMKFVGSLHLLDTEFTPKLRNYINSPLAKKVNSFFYSHKRSKRFSLVRYYKAKAVTDGLCNPRMFTQRKSEVTDRKRDFKKYLGKLKETYANFSKFFRVGINSINPDIARVLRIDLNTSNITENHSIDAFRKVYEKVMAIKDQTSLSALLEGMDDLAHNFIRTIGQWGNQLRKEKLSPEDRELVDGAYQKFIDCILYTT
jgi:hypothetical protein